EVQMVKTIGGHIVGMSTALEAIAARQAGMEILGFSLITNLAAGISPEPLSHTEVLQAGKDAEPVISELLARVVAAILWRRWRPSRRPALGQPRIPTGSRAPSSKRSSRVPTRATRMRTPSWHPGSPGG